MRTLTWLARASAFAGALVVAAPALGQAPKIGNNAAFIAQLKAEFKKTDLNQDTFLDKDELAKAFRGPKAKAPEQGMYDDQGRLTKTYYDAPKKYPGLVLLWAADKDNDDQLSWTEYESYQLKLLADKQQQQRALQRALQSSTRSLATSSRRYYGSRSSRYRGRSSVYSRPYRQVSYAQRSMQYQQQQMVRAAQNWQLMQVQAMANYQRMLQQAMVQRLQMQQMLMANYFRERQMAAAHRVVQRHQNPAVHAPARRR